MADDNEFKSRQERNERIKNIEYQVEQEEEIAEARKSKERTRRERAKRAEAKKEQEKSAAAEKQKEASVAANAKKKQNQQEAREIMEKNRQSKNLKNAGNQREKLNATRNNVDVSRIATNDQILASSIASSASNLAKENVSTELYQDGKQVRQVRERDLPQDLVKRIRNEQEKAIKQTENEIKQSTTDTEENNALLSSNLEKYAANNDINNTYNSSNNISVKINGASGFNVDVKNSTPKEVMSGNYNSSSERQNKSGENVTERNTIDSSDENRKSNNTIDVIIPDTTDLSNRDAIKANLARLNNNSTGHQTSDNKNDKLNIDSDKNDSTLSDAALLGTGVGIAASSANNDIRRRLSHSRSSSSQGESVADGKDIDSELSNRMASNARRATRIIGGAGRKIGGAAKNLKTAMKLKKAFTVGGAIASVGILIVIIILLVGVISFIMNMPGMVRDKLVDMWDTFWQEAKGLIIGQNQPSPTMIKNMAEYLESMGYDLVDNGFVTELEKDEEGNIKDIESKYLAAYIAAEQRSYLIANENHNVKEIWEGITGLLDEDSSIDEVWGTGMIVLERNLLEQIASGLIEPEILNMLLGFADNIASFFTGDSGNRDTTEVSNISNITKRVIIKRDTKEMFISKVDIIDAYNTGGYDVYRYSLKEWTEKYGTPTELFLTLHLATRAPEFAYKWATMYDTKVFLEIMELKNVDVSLVYAKTDENNKIVLDENGKPEMVPIAELDDATIKSKGISQSALEEMRKINNTKITAFTPYITKVLNHWYYQQVIFQGEYELADGSKKKIDVYEIRNLKETDPGYVRYYAYTRRDNADQEQIKNDSEDEEPVSNSGFMGLINVAIKVMTTVFTGGFSGISGFMTSISNAALNEAYNMLGDAVVDEISSTVMDALPDELAGMLNVHEFLKGNLSFDSLQKLAETGLNIDNLDTYLDFDKITNSLDIDNLQLNVDKLWDELNIQDELLNMDIADLGSINDLEKVVGNMNLENLNKVFDEQFDQFADFTDTSFDNLTNRLVGGFSSSIESIQNSIIDSCDQLFSGLSEADFGTISENLLNDVTKKISDLSVEPIINNLNSSIEELVEGKFNTEVLSGLQNEFSKQLTGLSYMDLSKMASIPDMDFNKLKNLSGQVTSITSALNGAENSINNLSNQVNRLSKDITGMDTRVLASVANSVQELDTKIEDLNKEAQSAQDTVNALNSSAAYKTQLLDKINELENKIAQLKNAGDKLELNEITKLQNEINACKTDINNITNKIEGVDDATLGKVKTQITSLENKATGVVDHIASVDITNLTNIKNRISDLDKVGLVELSNSLSHLDVSSNQMKTLVTKYSSDITDLRTSDINMIINGINGQNISTQQAINSVSKYLMRSDEIELANNLKTLNNSVKLINDLTSDFDIDTVANLVEKVSGFDSLHLNNIANQVKNLQNATINQLLNQVEELPESIVQNVSNQLTEKLKEGVKDGISANLSQKLKSNLTSTGDFSSKLKEAMTSGPKEEIDIEAEDDSVEAPYSEYSTGFYVREIRTQDYFQKAEPVRVLYPASHWIKLFREDKYVILDTPRIDMDKIDDPEYIEQYGKTIWDATNGNIQTAIYAMLQGIQSADSQYLFRYFKELFNDVSWIFDANYGFSQTIDPNAINPETIGWIFKTAKIKEPIYVGEPVEKKTENIVITLEDIKNNIEREITDEEEQLKLIEAIKDENNVDGKAYIEKYINEYLKAYVNASSDYDFYNYTYERKVSGNVQDDFYDGMSLEEILDATNNWWSYIEYEIKVKFYKYEGEELQEVEKAEYEPYTWAASKVGILNPKSIDPVYGFDEGLDIVSPVNGIVVAKTEARENELGQQVAQSVTIELRNTGDENADGMRIILIGGDYSSLMVGSLVRKVEYSVDEEGNYTGETSQSVIGKTTNESIKIMVLDKDQTPVDDVSDYIYPPFQQYTPLQGEDLRNEEQK